jgi:nucleotide-binding universal stress UspA family protein
MIAMQRILCPVDLSDISKRALDYTALIAKWYGAKVRVVLVEPVVLSPVDFPPMPAVMGLTPEARQKLNTRLGDFVGTSLRGVDFEPVLKEGFVVPEILADAKGFGADLVVLGTHGRGGFQHLVLGSVTEKLLRKLACPVLTVPPGADEAPGTPGPFTSILCGMDFSDASLTALEYAMSLAEEAGSRLTVVHSVPWELEDEAELQSPPVAEYRQLREAAARKRLDALIPESVKEVCEVETIVVVGKPWRELDRLARDTVADLIVLGVHGRGVVDLALFGSTTHQVIRHAPCPVLTVRAH